MTELRNERTVRKRALAFWNPEYDIDMNRNKLCIYQGT